MAFINMPGIEDAREETFHPNWVPPEGNLDADICIITDSPSSHDLEAKRHLQGEIGKYFEHCLHKAGKLRGEVFITSFSGFPITKAREPQYINNKGALKGDGLKLRDRLLNHLESTNCNVYVPLGPLAASALCGPGSLNKRRGYMYPCTLPSGRVIKVLPTLHPKSGLYGGSFMNIWYISHDFMKAAKLSTTPEIIYDESQIEIPKNFDEAVKILTSLIGVSPIAFDIEVINYQVSCISFSNKPEWCTSIPIHGVWTLEEEVKIWDLLCMLLEDKSTTKIGQNLIFDISFLLINNGIKVQGPIIDTMIGHHMLYPDMLKGLGFLASLYTNRPYWKDMIDWKSIKADD